MKDVVIFGQKCSMCGELHITTYPWIGFMTYVRQGKLIQDAMPDVSAENREFLISGICPDCQKEIFITDDEGDDCGLITDDDVNEVDEIDWMTNNGLN